MKMKLSYFLPAVLSATFFATASAIAVSIPDDCKTGGFALGCQAWTFKNFTVFEAIDKTAEVGGKVIEFFPGQTVSEDEDLLKNAKLDPNASDEVIAKVQEHLKAKGIRAVNFGVVPIPQDEAGARKIFEFAKKLGLYGITTESVESIDTIEKLVKEYDIRVGFHDHPKRPDDPNYKMWDPNYILSVVKDRDPRIGSTADIGHWVRSGLVPVECLKILKGRIISVHMKDLNERALTAHDVPWGTGVSDIAGVLDELKKQNFVGNVSAEYEYDWDNSVPEVAQCIGFVRGYETGQLNSAK
jgi:sugar phosphate isomerase/epimerase